MGYGVNLWPVAILAVIGAVLGLYEGVRVVMWLAHHLHWSLS
jgi:uncharacterized membrane protein YfcA